MPPLPGTSPAGRRSITLWAITLDERVPADVMPRVPATFRLLGPSDLPDLAWATGAAGTIEFARRLREGRRCCAALVHSRPVAHAWVTAGGGEEEIGEVGMRLRLARSDAYIWDCATAIPLRQQLLFTALIAHVAAGLRAEGYARAWIGADSDNVASRRGIAHAGFQPVADLTLAGSDGPDGVQLAEVRGVLDAPAHLVDAARAGLVAVRKPDVARALRTDHRDGEAP